MPHTQLPPQRRITDDADMPLARRISIENRMDALEEKLDKNTELTQNVVTIFGTLESGIKVLGWLGAAAKWVVTIVGAGAAIWALATGRDPRA